MAPMNGTIKRLVSDKGFGFILASDGNEYFFHNSACADTRFDDLREGQAVTFEKGQGPKGPRGENVRVAGSPFCTSAPASRRPPTPNRILDGPDFLSLPRATPPAAKPSPRSFYPITPGISRHAPCVAGSSVR
jgi:CspA family cold shock protein